MKKKHIVRLSDSEATELREMIKSLDGSSQKVRRANILLAVNDNGPGWSDLQAAEAYHCSSKTVENIRRRFVEEGFGVALHGKMTGNSGRPKKFDGDQEAKLIALRLGDPPKGYSNWSLRLVAKRAVELQIVESICTESVRTTLKKRLYEEKD